MPKASAKDSTSPRTKTRKNTAKGQRASISKAPLPVKVHKKPAPPLPWDADGKAVADYIKDHVRFDAMALGVVNVRQPRPDELLAVEGIKDASLSEWFQSGFTDDKLFKQAQRKGTAATSPDKPGDTSDLVSQQHVMMQMAPDSMNQGRWWWLMLARNTEEFTLNEREQANLILRRWQALFDRDLEPYMSRLMIGYDERLVAADLDIQEKIQANPDFVRDLLAEVKPVISQRFPTLEDGEVRDIAVDVDDELFWVCVKRSRATDIQGAEHWQLQLRPLDDEELPPIGEVKDERVAEALAFLHENFQASPSLADISHEIHMSPFHFHRLFTKQIGISPKHYLQKKQLQVAKWLLRSGRTPIGTIAEKAGFSSHGHFTSTFHRIIGVSPSQYREMH